MIATDGEREVQHVAASLYAEDPDWVTFYREILGLHGVVRHMFPTRELLGEFEKTETYREIQQMLARRRAQGLASAESQEPTRVITVRLPKSLHEALRIEAHEHCTSMNKLCISKLLQIIDKERIPAET